MIDDETAVGQLHPSGAPVRATNSRPSETTSSMPSKAISRHLNEALTLLEA